MNTVRVAGFEIGAGNPLALLAGPCVLEGLERCLYIGRTIRDITRRLGKIGRDTSELQSR